MPKTVKHEYTCILTNGRKPKPHHAVIRQEGDTLVMEMDGETQPLPEGFELHIKGKFATRVGEYLATASSLGSPKSTKKKKKDHAKG